MIDEIFFNFFKTSNNKTNILLIFNIPNNKNYIMIVNTTMKYRFMKAPKIEKEPKEPSPGHEATKPSLHQQ